jgi:hypothetical protein
MRRKVLSAVMVLAVLFVFAGAVPLAHAVLQQAGPVDNTPSIGGYPKWYQDTTGLALEFCDPQNADEVDGGWCLLLPADVPAPPEVFPGEFADEHFWFAADASITPPANPGLRVLLVLATEAAFGGAVEPGGQIAFNRIRVRLDPVPVTGLYRFIHPYGEELIEGTAGDRIFSSDDVGLSPGDFTALLTSRLGPFLLPSATPGGAELAAVTGPVAGKLYIADPGRLGPVTGSPLPDFIDSTGASRDHNIFRVEGPVGSNLDSAGNDFIETTDFSLMGRIFQGAIAARVTVNRASYERPDAETNKIDVFATALPSTQGRIPPNPTPAVTTPNLVFYDGPCFDPDTGDPALAGLASSQMFFAGSNYWGQSAPAAIPQNPAEVCVVQTNALDAGGGLTSAFFPAPLGDKVDITEALFTPATQTLLVRAISRDVVGAPTLTVAGLGPIVGGQLLLSPLMAPPAKVTVHSSQGGSNEFQVSTAVGTTGPAAGVPVALNDAATVAEDSGTTAIDVLANDTVDGLAIPAGATIAIVAAPPLGGAVVNITGTAIDYTPNPNANGTDSFTYTVTVGGVISNVASVTVTITPENDPPVANPDNLTAVANITTPLNVLANDTDPDGAADIVAVANVSAVTPAGATATAAGNVVNFTATAAGTYTFTYQAQDAATALSNTATVTVTVAPAEVLTITRALYRAAANRYRVNGTITPAAGQTITLDLLNGSTVIRTDTVPSSAIGVWILDVLDVVLPNIPLVVRATSSNGTVATANLVRR